MATVKLLIVAIFVSAFTIVWTIPPPRPQLNRQNAITGYYLVARKIPGKQDPSANHGATCTKKEVTFLEDDESLEITGIPFVRGNSDSEYVYYNYDLARVPAGHDTTVANPVKVSRKGTKTTIFFDRGNFIDIISNDIPFDMNDWESGEDEKYHTLILKCRK